MRLCLYQPDMAPNVGAAIRTAACFGVPLDIIEPCGFPLTGRDIKRVAMDYSALHDPVRHASFENWQKSPERANHRIILMTTKAAGSLYDFVFKPDDIIMMGRESAGVPEEIHKKADARIFIPMVTGARSLNVIVSAAVALSEAKRQFHASSPRACTNN